MKIKIKSINGKVLFTYESEKATIKDAVEKAIEENISLRFANLSSADLRSANLSSANLSSADLRSANLYSADLRSANLYSADLYSAYLYSADLRSADLRSADLRSADLSSADLLSADLRSADLRSADLRSANLSSANLSSANLRSADLSSAENIEKANLPIYCKWNHSIVNDKIKIACKEKTIEEWDLFFESNEVFETKRNTEEFKQIQAVYESYKAYLTFLNK